MKINTTRFGEIEIAEDSIISIPRGLLGFAGFNRFCVLQDRPDTPLKWLQSVEDPSLAFVVIDPSQFFMDYEIEISDDNADLLEIRSADEAVVMTLVTVARDGSLTTNLLGPIVINVRTLAGMQVVLQNDNYHTKHCVGTLADAQNELERPELRAAAA